MSTTRSAAESPDTSCFHCGLPLPRGARIVLGIEGRDVAFCCPGCAAVCDSILAAGLGDYYRHRSVPTGRAADPLPDELVSAGVYDLPAVQEGFVSALDGGECEASLTLDGIACAACAWLIERQLQRVDGVAQADVNFASHRAAVRYDPQRTTVSALLAAVHGVGYAAYPYDPARAERELEAERRRRLRDLGLAGVLGVQIMMLALASYLGEWSGMETGTGRLLDFASLVLAGIDLLVH